MTSIPDPHPFACKACCDENGWLFEGTLFHGQCSFCDNRWVDIVEMKGIANDEDIAKQHREGNGVNGRLREEFR